MRRYDLVRQWQRVFCRRSELPPCHRYVHVPSSKAYSACSLAGGIAAHSLWRGNSTKSLWQQLNTDEPGLTTTTNSEETFTIHLQFLYNP